MTGARGAGSRLPEAVVLAVLAGGVLFDSLGYPPPLVENAPGPAFFPRLIAFLLLGCALGLAFRGRRPSAPATGGDAAAGAGAAPDGTRRELRRWGAALWVAAFLLAAPVLGSLAALPALVGGLLFLSGERSYGVLIAIPLAFAAFLHLLFERLLGVPLP